MVRSILLRAQVSEIRVSSYKYIGSDVPQIGIMAQDLLKNEVLKDSVVTSDTGHF